MAEQPVPGHVQQYTATTHEATNLLASSGRESEVKDYEKSALAASSAPVVAAAPTSATALAVSNARKDDRSKTHSTLLSDEKDGSSLAGTSSSNGRLEKSEEAGITSDSAATEEEDENIGAKYISGWKLYFLVFGLCITNFLIGLDQSILATAIPKITSQFQSLDDVGWYGSAYLLATTSLQPSFGKIYTYFNIKYTYIIALVIFEVGSIVCAVAKNSPTLIIGRAIAGAGAAGLYSGGMTMIAFAVPLRQRPLFIACLSSMFGIASIVGPILGGALTDSRLTWRWCFWINLPFGGVAILTILFFFRNPERQYSTISLKQKLKNMDPLGAFLLMGAIVCLLLALQWGGLTYPWSNSKIWGNFIGFGLLAIAFIVVQIRQGDNATIPLKILKQRTVLASALVLIFLSMGLYVHIYYLPFYFQAVKGTSARQSGINVVPYLISNTIFSIIAGILVTVLGYYTPLITLGSALFTVGCGLLYTLKVDSGKAKWIGYQILTGGGSGMAIQLPFVAVQVVLPPKDVPSGNAIAIFFNTLGGAVAISIATNIFNNELTRNLVANAPDLNAATIVRAGAEGIRLLVPKEKLSPVLQSYNQALTTTFLVAVAVAGLAFLSSFLFEWKTVKGKKVEMSAGAA